jgi:hypothetical protein
LHASIWLPSLVPPLEDSVIRDRAFGPLTHGEALPAIHLVPAPGRKSELKGFLGVPLKDLNVAEAIRRPR